MKINGDLIISDTNTKLKDAINPTFSYAQIKSSNAKSTVTSETIIKGWQWEHHIGDFYCSAANGYLLVPHGTAKVIQIAGVIAGCFNFTARYHIQDGNAVEMDYNAAGFTYQSLGILHNAAGNQYWKMAMPTVTLEIPDTTKDWYIYLLVGPYNVDYMYFNTGFGAASWMSVTKLA